MHIIINTYINKYKKHTHINTPKTSSMLISFLNTPTPPALPGPEPVGRCVCVGV